MYVLTHMNNESLQEACQTLYELYEHQIEKMNTLPLPAPQVQRAPIGSNIRHVEPQPFYITD
jgi:hypothetical protein